MSGINNLFVCSECGTSIAPQMNRLDMVQAKLKGVNTIIDVAIKQLEELKNELKESKDV